jgi:hypothetical protein
MFGQQRDHMDERFWKGLIALLMLIALVYMAIAIYAAVTM